MVGLERFFFCCIATLFFFISFILQIIILIAGSVPDAALSPQYILTIFRGKPSPDPLEVPRDTPSNKRALRCWVLEWWEAQVSVNSRGTGNSLW